MHSSKFTALAQAADESAEVVVSVVEDVAANADTDVVFGAVILQREDTVTVEEETRIIPRFTFARFAIGKDAVTFEGRQDVYGNVSKAFKFLSDYTLDRRPLVHMEDGSLVESQDGEKSTPAAA
jgi:hypothetical protein